MCICYFGLTDAYVWEQKDEIVEINETNFLDENFRKYVAENCDSNGDGVLSVEEQLNKCNGCVDYVLSHTVPLE